MKTTKIIGTVLLIPLLLLLSVPFFAPAMSIELYQSVMQFLAYLVIIANIVGIVYLYRN